ncbi:MAG: winged helix-turn-helix transcriptional regulator [Clostridiales bacterium]|jgi:predicted transcriptional regulator|nr:winged helix-turn-helix transcriptional regulator [Clostridiales bacterium]
MTDTIPISRILKHALSSELRLDILRLLMKNKKMNMQDISRAVSLSNGALTPHIKKLEAVGLICVEAESGIRGVQKLCSPNKKRILIEFHESDEIADRYTFEIGIGQYSSYDVSPTCGLVTAKSIVGEFDDPRYFAFPERAETALIWFTHGYLEYKIPNPLRINERPTELQLSMELASEAPGFVAHYPSDIHFSINGTDLGYWTSPGEFNDKSGLFTPKWWFPNLGQYGRLKLLSIGASGSYIDGLKISDVKIDDLKIDSLSDLSFRLSAPKTAVNKGGLSLFGKGFGDYSQGIGSTILFEKIR